MPRVVVFDEFGGPEVMHLVEEPSREPGGGEVRVRIEAAAVNPLDVMMRAGHSPAPVPLPHARLGVEATGTIDALGPGVTAWSMGDPVILAAIPDASVSGSYAEYTTVPAGRVIPRPAELGVVEAAAIWVGFSTAYGALIEKAQLRPGDHVLITAAAGAVGRAAIQVAHQIGAIPIALTRSGSRRDELRAAGAAAVINTAEGDLVAAVRDLTGGAGADVVLDLVMGPGQAALIDAARPDATLVVAGFLDPRPAPVPQGPPLTTHRYRSFEHTLDPVVLERMAAFLDAGLRQGSMRPAIDDTFALEAAGDAHRRVESGRHSGKIVLTI